MPTDKTNPNTSLAHRLSHHMDLFLVVKSGSRKWFPCPWCGTRIDIMWGTGIGYDKYVNLVTPLKCAYGTIAEPIGGERRKMLRALTLAVFLMAATSTQAAIITSGYFNSLEELQPRIFGEAILQTMTLNKFDWRTHRIQLYPSPRPRTRHHRPICCRTTRDDGIQQAKEGSLTFKQALPICRVFYWYQCWFGKPRLGGDIPELGLNSC